MKIQYLFRLKIYNARVCRLLSTCSLLLSSRCCRCCSCCHCCRHHRRHRQVFVAASLYRYLLICDCCHHRSSLSPIHANPLLPYITASSPFWLLNMLFANFGTFILALTPPSPSIYPPNVSWCALPTHNIFLLSITEPTSDAVEEMTPNQAHMSSPMVWR